MAVWTAKSHRWSIAVQHELDYVVDIRLVGRAVATAHLMARGSSSVD